MQDERITWEIFYDTTIMLAARSTCTRPCGSWIKDGRIIVQWM